MKNIRCFLSHHRWFYLLLLFLPLKIWFDWLELTLAPRYVTSTGFDRGIPFVGVFVVPYLLWFLYVPYGVVYTGLHSKKDFCRLVFFLLGGMAAANLIFMLFPNAQDLRPSALPGDPFSALVGFVYSVDTPTNVCPSIHVINSLAVYAALRHSEAFSAKRAARAAAFVLTVLICLSTVFIKQHSVFDVVCGLAVSALFYVPLYVLPGRGAGLRRAGSDGKINAPALPDGRTDAENGNAGRCG